VIDFLFCFTYVPNAAALGHKTRHDPVLLLAVSSMLWSILYGSFLKPSLEILSICTEIKTKVVQWDAATRKLQI
jgi:hypothetical protein